MLLLVCPVWVRRTILLRITTVDEGLLGVALKLEGRIVSDWVAVLEHECIRSLGERRNVVLDFSAVTFVGGRGVQMLKRIATEHLQIVNVSPLVKDLLQAGEDL